MILHGVLTLQAVILGAQKAACQSNITSSMCETTVKNTLSDTANQI